MDIRALPRDECNVRTVSGPNFVPFFHGSFDLVAPHEKPYVYQTTLKEVGFAMMSLVDLAFAYGTPLRSHQHTSTDRFPPISRRRASFNGLQSTATPFRSVLNGLDFSSRSLHSNEDGALRTHVYDVTSSSLTTSAILIVSGILVTSKSRRLPDADSRCHRLPSSRFLTLTHRFNAFLESCPPGIDNSDVQIPPRWPLYTISR